MDNVVIAISDFGSLKFAQSIASKLSNVINKNVIFYITKNLLLPLKQATGLNVANIFTSDEVSIEDLILLIRPSDVILGLSAKNQMANSTIRACVKQAISFSVIQDYWGFLGNLSSDIAPKQIYVIDEYAANETRRKIDAYIGWREVKLTLMGLIKYESMGHIKVPFGRKFAARSRVAFIGQPKSYFGLLKAEEEFIKLLISLRFEIIYFAHPSDARHKYKHYYINSRLLKVKTRLDMEVIARRCGVIATLFSTGAFDLQIAFLRKNGASIPVLYDLTSASVRRLLNLHGTGEIAPMKTLGLGNRYLSQGALVRKLVNIKNNKTPYTKRNYKALRYLISDKVRQNNFSLDAFS